MPVSLQNHLNWIFMTLRDYSNWKWEVEKVKEKPFVLNKQCGVTLSLHQAEFKGLYSILGKKTDQQ